MSPILSQPPSTKRDPSDRDVIALSSAPMSELASALTAAVDKADGTMSATSRTRQIAALMADEAVRLIRVGSRDQLAVEGLAVARLLAGQHGPTLRERDAHAYELVQAVTIMLDTAAAAASKGGELAVLRSWDGHALKVLALVPREPGRAIPRRAVLAATQLSESYLSHVLADLEAAGLIIRIREGRLVNLYLGPCAYEPKVAALLERADRPDALAEVVHLDAHRRRRPRLGGTDRDERRPVAALYSAAAGC